MRKIIYYSAWIMFRLLEIILNAKYQGSENIPKSGPFVLASNHKHNLDPILIASSIYREVYFFAKKELWNNKILGWFISKGNAFPVKRRTIDRSVFKETKKVFSQGYGLVFFPEGTRGAGNDFLKPKAGIGMLINQVGIPISIIPSYIHASNNLLDCFLRKKQLVVIIGRPITSEEVKNYLTDKNGYQELADRIMAEIVILRDRFNFQKSGTIKP